MNDNIFVPQFNVTPQISSAIEIIDRSNWLISNMLLMPKHETWIRREVSVQRAAGTTRIEGAGMDDAEVNELVKKGPRGKPTEDERANLNALEAYAFVDYLSDQPEIPVDELVIRELNRYLLRSEPELLTPGVYRNGQNEIRGFMPPDQGDVSGLMRAFARWLQARDDDIQPILKAGIAHIQLVAIHPFWDGNGRTGRALATLILQRSPPNFKKLLSLEWFLSGIRDQYLDAIERALGKHFTPNYDATPWLEFFVNSLMAHAMQLTDKLTEWHREMDRMHKEFADLKMNQRQADGLAYAFRTGRITRADYIEITHTSPMTASRDLARLAESGWLIPKGKTRSRVYFFRKEGPGANKRPAEEQLPLLGQGAEKAEAHTSEKA